MFISFSTVGMGLKTLFILKLRTFYHKEKMSIRLLPDGKCMQLMEHAAPGGVG